MSDLCGHPEFVGGEVAEGSIPFFPARNDDRRFSHISEEKFL
jgi:hypothetical protein